MNGQLTEWRVPKAPPEQIRAALLGQGEHHPRARTGTHYRTLKEVNRSWNKPRRPVHPPVWPERRSRDRAGLSPRSWWARRPRRPSRPRRVTSPPPPAPRVSLRTAPSEGAVPDPQRPALLRCSGSLMAPPRTSARSLPVGTPTPPRRTPSAPAPSAWSRSSTTSRRTRTTSPIAPVGLAGSADFGVRADALPIVAEGHNVYGLLFDAGTGFRKMVRTNIPTGAQPESIYAVLERHLHHAGSIGAASASATPRRSPTTPAAPHGCAEHLDGLHRGTLQRRRTLVAGGPRERYVHERRRHQPSNISMGFTKPFVTGFLRNNGTTNFALDGGDANGATLTSVRN